MENKNTQEFYIKIIILLINSIEYNRNINSFTLIILYYCIFKINTAMSRNLIKSIVLIQKTNFSLKKLPFLLFHYNLSSNTIENNENQLIKNKSFRIDRDTIHKKLNMNDSMLKTIPFNTKSNQKRNELDEIKKDIKYGIEDSKYTQVIRAIEKARYSLY